MNPLRTWAVTIDTFDQYYQQGKIVFPDDYDFLNISKPAFRYWKEDDMAKAGESFGLMAASTKLPEDVGMSLDGTKEITELMGGKIFSYPKTLRLIKFFIELSAKLGKDSIILDFFSGSATTAHTAWKIQWYRPCLRTTSSRTGEDLLFQVMLECKLPLSAKIETEQIAGKEVFSVNDGYLIACFDEKVKEEVITAIAKRKPYYFVMRDSSLASDNVADNFEQIFQAYSKDTIRRIL